MFTDLLGLAFLLPIGLIGLLRWGSWLFRRTIGLFYVPEPVRDYKCKVSLITPVYKENVIAQPPPFLVIHPIDRGRLSVG